MTIEELLHAFHQCAKESQNQLTEMLSTISEGRVPSRTDISQFELVIANLRVKYDCVYQAAADQLPSDELPPDNAPASAFVEALKNSEALRIKQQLEQARNILQRFISVRSLVTTYSDALRPFQKEAAALLESLDEAKVQTDVVTEALAGPQVLLTALDFPDKETEEGFAICDQITDYYPKRVYAGIVADKYFLDENTPDSAIFPQASVSRQPEETTVESASIPEPEPKAVQEEISSCMEADSCTEQPYADVVAKLHEKACFLTKDESDAAVEFEASQNETKKITSSIFRNEIRVGKFAGMQKIPKERQIILNHICKMNLLTPEILVNYYNIPEKIAESSIAYLMQKGYLSKYSITPGGSFYCASERLLKALEFKDACKAMDIRPQPVGTWGGKIPKTVPNVASRTALVNLYGAYASRFKGLSAFKTLESISILTNSFCIGCRNGTAPEKCAILAGIFWDTDQECSDFLDNLRKLVSESQTISCFILAAWDLQYAKSIIRILLDALKLSEEELPLYLYSLSENAYYRYPDCEPIREEQISELSVISSKPDDQHTEESVDEDVIQVTEEIEAEAPTEETFPNPEEETEGKTDESQPMTEPVPSAVLISSTVEKASSEPPLEDLDLIHRLVRLSAVPSDDELYVLISGILNGEYGTDFTEDSSIVQALLLAKAASFSPHNFRCSILYSQLTYAVKSPLEEVIYTSANLSGVFDETCSDALLLSAYLLAMLTPGEAYDYSLNSQTDNYLNNFDSYFPDFPEIKTLYVKLHTLRDIVPVGFSPAILARLGSDSESEKYISAIQLQARELLEYSTPKTRMKALPLLYSSCFGKNSDLYHCLEYVADNDPEGIELVNLLLNEFCTEKADILTIAPSKVEAYLDSMWFKVNGHNSSFTLEFTARQQALKQLNSRLKVLANWAEHAAVLPNEKYDFARLGTLKQEIVMLSEKAQHSIAQRQFPYQRVLLWSLREIQQYLCGTTQSNPGMFRELLQTGVISLDDAGLPILSEELDSVKYCEPWRTVLRHILSPIGSMEEARNEILNGGISSDLFDNLRQLEMIGRLNGENLRSTPAEISEARASAEDVSKDFDDALELAYTYNRISETEKENLAAIKSQHEETLLGRLDFGIWRQFLNALTHRIDELTEIRKKELQGMLDARLTSEAGMRSPILQDAQKLLDVDRNFAVTEEYINRFDNGEESFTEELQAVLHEEDHFADFISDKVFRPLYEECYRRKDGGFRNMAKEYLPLHYPKDWTSRLKDDCLRLVLGDHLKNIKDSFWPYRKGMTTPEQITNLFNWLGMKVNRTAVIKKSPDEIFQIEVEPSPRSQADYRHPISAFGTQAKKQMNVVVLYGNVPSKQLVDKITELGLGRLSIVLIDFPIDLSVRRKIAEDFHNTSGQNPFIVIDQVLVLYLALHQITERLPIMLKCTLPFTTYQPFVRDGGSTADEMFFGRSKELADILNPNGACVVYGGRQLGKTALLERAESLSMKPEKKDYAVYCNILNCDTEQDMVQKVIEDVRKKAGLDIQPCDSIKSLSDGIEKLFHSQKVEKMLLLLDETDKFLGSIANQDYAQLQPLIDLKRSTKNQFKFVLAGLHNVCRAKNATARNGVFGQLGTPLCIKPLSPTDALQLLSRPLKYLGFQIDRYPHLETILTNTNYYPGILQFFGYMLVETLSTHYGKYYRSVDGNPPYTLQDDQLGAVMNSADLNRSIRDKFRWSLELDPRYFMIARCIAVLYYMSDEAINTWLGFSIDQIKEIAESYQIHCLQNESEGDYCNLLDEMVEMGILSKPDNEKRLYRLRRSSFINIIGSDFDAVDADITRNNPEV